MQVVINVNNSHVEASFTAAQPEVRQALEAAMPKLKEMLAEAGISLGQTSVNAGASQHQGGNAQQHARAVPGRNPGSSNREDSTAGTPLRSQSQVIMGGNGLVDTFA